MLTIAQELRLEQKADLGGSAANTLCEIDSPIPVAIPKAMNQRFELASASCQSCPAICSSPWNVAFLLCIKASNQKNVRCIVDHSFRCKTL